MIFLVYRILYRQTRPFFVGKGGVLPCLDGEELRQLDALMNRINILAEAAQKSGVRLMVDAEQTYFQPGIDHIVMNLQRKYNREYPAIFGTYQAYLKDATQRLQIDIRRARKENFKFAAKIVRGAYMIAERRRAEELGIEDPIQPDLENTHKNYHRCLDIMFEVRFAYFQLIRYSFQIRTSTFPK